LTISLERHSTTPVSVVAPAPSVRWLAVLALAIGGFGIGTTEFVAMGLLPDIASSFAISEPTAGHIISAYALGVVVGAPLFAALTARMPRKTVLLGLMAVFTLSNLASMFAPSYEMLMAARFVAGLPHGAFFGVAAMVASFLMGPRNRAKAVAHVMTGLTVATVVGVPMASWLGQALGWRSAFGLVVAVGVVTLTAIAFWLPPLRSMHVTSPLTELGALKRVQVWLAMLVGMIGFGGMFAVYTYISTTTGILRYNPVNGTLIDTFVPAGSGGLGLAHSLRFGLDRHALRRRDDRTLRGERAGSGQQSSEAALVGRIH